jgi:hypothetical protein
MPAMPSGCADETLTSSRTKYAVSLWYAKSQNRSAGCRRDRQLDVRPAGDGNIRHIVAQM